MTPAQERVIKAAEELSIAANTVYSLEKVPSKIIHELFSAVNMLHDEKTLGSTGEFPDGKLNQHDEGELKLMISHNEDLIRLDFGKPTAWIAMPKAQGITFAFTILEHCGIKVEQHDLTKGKPS